jgi:hypothetical protein
LLQATVEDNHAFFQRPRDHEETRRQLYARHEATDQVVTMHVTAFVADYELFLDNTILGFLRERLEFLKKLQKAPQATDHPNEGVLALKQQHLRWLRAELEYHLDSNQQERIRSRADRAFDHLNRLIVVDSDFQRAWETTFDNEKEPGCENRGAVHLLWHGIFAFKARSEGETDLVFGEPITEQVAGVSDGLVLTEWKRCETGDGATEYAKAKERALAFTQARIQADIYAKGILGGILLKKYRYLVVVSKIALPPKMIFDEPDGDIVYRRVNIVVKPDKPRATTERLAKTV